MRKPETWVQVFRQQIEVTSFRASLCRWRHCTANKLFYTKTHRNVSSRWISPAFGILLRAVWYKCANVSEQSAASIFRLFTCSPSKFSECRINLVPMKPGVFVNSGLNSEPIRRRWVLRFLDHTQRRTTHGRTPLDEWSASRRDLYLTTPNTHNRQTSMPPVGFEPAIPTSEWPQTDVLDSAAIGTSPRWRTLDIIIHLQCLFKMKFD